MSDLAAFLVHTPQFIVTWATFFGAGLIVYALYIWRNRKNISVREFIHHCIPFNILTEKSFHADVIIYSISKLTIGIIILPATILSVWCAVHISHSLEYNFPLPKKFEFNFYTSALCTIMIFLVTELSDFICHYAEHKVPFLWELHKVHHSAQVLNPLTSQREHPGTRIFESLVRGVLNAIPGGIFIFLFDLSVIEIAALPLIATRIFALASLDPLKHSHHPISLGIFDKILISPHMHQVHHSKKQEHWDRNFGTSLSIFDWLAGTAYKPARGEEALYGISGLKDETLKKYNTIRGAYWAPLQKSYKKIKKMLGEQPIQQKTETSAKF